MSNQSPGIEDKISGLEKTLALDERLQALEAAIQERLPAAKPWWRDAKVVTFLGALIAAILPVATWINNAYASSREYNLALLKQQEDIRQKYLDRVLRPGVTPDEQEKVFGLLSRLSSDRELQRWAQEELAKASELVNLKAQLEIGQKELADAQATVSQLQKTAASNKESLTDADKKLKEAQKNLQSLSERYKFATNFASAIAQGSLDCSIEFRSEPPGASVKVEAQSAGLSDITWSGQTPMLAPLDRGKPYTATFDKPGYLSGSVPLTLKDKNCDGIVFAGLAKIEK